MLFKAYFLTVVPNNIRFNVGFQSSIIFLQHIFTSVYSRRNCLLVHGIVEETVEDADEKIINTLRQSMDETIKPENSDRSHRLGKPKS